MIQIQENRTYNVNNKIWALIITLILVIGIFFRFYNLEKKVYWVDEVATSIRISGHTKQEIVEKFASSDYITADILKSYQQVESTSEISDTFRALIKSPEHAPLYFLLARFWVGLFGSSVAAIRSLSVIFSLLALPCIYWLCSELFQLPQVGLISLLLLSVSPFYIAYAQEARPYSLWTITILLSNISLLRAVRLNTRQKWLMYSITTVLGLYTSLLSTFVISGQLLYVVTIEKFQFTQTVKRYLNSLLLLLLAFSPWLAVMMLHWQEFAENTAWMREAMDLSAMITIWITPILLIFGDLPFPSSLQGIKSTGIAAILLVSIFSSLLIYYLKMSSINRRKPTKRFLFLLLVSLLSVVLYHGIVVFSPSLDYVFFGGMIIALLVIALIIYSVYYSLISLSFQKWLFLAISSLAIPVSLIAIDFVLSGQSSGAPRYMIPSQLGLQISVSYLLYSKSVFTLSETKKRNFWRLVTILLISLGIFSCTLNLNKSPFYQKSRNLHNIPIATILNNHEQAIVFSEPSQALDLLSLSHHLNQDIKIYPLNNTAELQNLDQDKSVFVFNPSQYIKQEISKKNIQSKLIYDPERFISNEIVLTLWEIQE